ncbi:MAG: HAD family phosphatase [Streptococcaceae bacterium]|jgi:HAD superfamily hydrolase (TIGR01509 family)|nr:HAD family phosphatase [Streptococcaceae bacterium]
MKTKFKAVIFDMDGVLVDTERFFHQKRLDYIQSLGIDTSDFSKSYFAGGRMQDMWPKLLGESYHEADVEKLQRDYKAFKEATNYSYKDLLFPGAVSLLSFLQQSDYKLAIASSSDHQQIERCFREANLGRYFDEVCSGEDFKETKPHPEIYLTAMAKLEVTAEETLVIEDSTMGIEAGKAAGATVWAIRDNFFGMDQSQADLLVDNLEGIREKLADK